MIITMSKLEQTRFQTEQDGYSKPRWIRGLWVNYAPGGKVKKRKRKKESVEHA